MRHATRTLVFLVLALGCSQAIAMASNFVWVGCGANLVEIKSDYAEAPAALDNSPGFALQNFGQVNECHLKSGDVVRVKFGFHFRAISMSQTSWVSIWFDRKKWVSRMNVEVAAPDEPRAASIDVSDDGVTLCMVQGSILDDVDGDAANSAVPKCALIPRDHLRRTVDVHEPKQPDESEKPLVPPVILMGGGDMLCKGMADVNQATRERGVNPARQLWLNFPTGDFDRIDRRSALEPQEWMESYAFDLDNSGSHRHVLYRQQSMGDWEDYDIYLTLDDADYRTLRKAAVTDEDLLRYAKSAWPVDWLRQSDRAKASKELSKLNLKFLTSGQLEGEVSIPANHLHIVPFSYASRTYLLLFDALSGGAAFVVKPHPGGKLDQVCVFQAGEVNF